MPLNLSYYSKQQLTTPFADYSNVYPLPITCTLGILANLISTLVALKVQHKDLMMKYILINSALDFLFLQTQFFSFLIRCGTLCPYGFAYISKLIENYIYWFIGYDIITFQAIFNLFMTLERLSLFSHSQQNKYQRFLSKISLKWIVVVFLSLAVLVNTPFYLVIHEIRPLGLQNESQEILYSTFVRSWDNEWVRIVITILTLLKSPILIVLTGVINVVVVVKFKKFLRKKETILNLASSPGLLPLCLYFLMSAKSFEL
jgi:hypothetical protein